MTTDFQQLPHGDMSRVGDSGASLSGGQKARVNLARAVYRQADIYLLDDPLSAVDARVAKHLFEKCIQQYLGGRTRILVTHQLQFVKQADTIVVLDRVSIFNVGAEGEETVLPELYRFQGFREDAWILPTTVRLQQELHRDDR